ncbi:hypothetical protein ACFQS2_12660 [Brachybacterium sp. GCM10030267]|uniref:hypothetical protein n=1 Tax=Brachybacterium sp. GCM10030267 TaxID=3273381 RepID=UPI00360D25C7
MTEERDGLAPATDEQKHRQNASGGVRPDLEVVPMASIPLQARRQFAFEEVLNEWYPHGKAPWTRMQCDIGGRLHDTGVEMRLERRDAGRWWVRVRWGKRYGKVMTVAAAEYEAPEATEPNWCEIRCRVCDKPTRRDPVDFLGDAMFDALAKYRDRLTDQGRVPAGGWPPQVHWRAPTA